MRSTFEPARSLLAIATGNIRAARAAHAEAIALRVKVDLPFRQADRLHLVLVGSRIAASEHRNGL